MTEAGPSRGREGGRSPADRRERAVERAVDRADFDPDFDPDAPIACEVCGGTMEYTASCKLVCGNRGYVRDCSDP